MSCLWTLFFGANKFCDTDTGTGTGTDSSASVKTTGAVPFATPEHPNDVAPTPTSPFPSRKNVAALKIAAPGAPTTHFFKLASSPRFRKCHRPPPLSIDSANATRHDTLSKSLTVDSELTDAATLTRLDSDLDAAISPSWFNLDGDMMRAKVIDVYDGDTVTLVFQFGARMWKDKCRLRGIDTPEIRTRDADEKVRGLEARDWLRAKLLNQKVWVECGKWDKYGRLLGTIYLTSDFQQSVNQELINHGFAVPYFGGYN
jgi:micrococcal nuclease